MIVAALALVFAMVGTAVAGTDGVGKLTKSSVKKIAKKQADKELKKNVAGSHVNTADQATNATNATNAGNSARVGSQVVSKVFQKIPSGTGTTTIYQGNGLTVSFDCSAGGLLTVNAATSVDDTYIGSNAGDQGTSGGDRDSNFDTGETFDPIAGLGRGEGSMTYVQPDGTFVQIQFATDDSDTLGTFDGCHFTGTVTATN